MPDINKIIELALSCGFTHSGKLDIQTLVFMPEVRDMCASDRCHSYGKSWTCPPGCGTLEECENRVKDFSCGVLLQTVGILEDEFDIETMTETMEKHKQNLNSFVCELSKISKRILPMGAGACTLCSECTYPDAPCRFPDKAITSIEANGLFVSKVCEDNGLKYYYGKNTLAYTSACLFEC